MKSLRILFLLAFALLLADSAFALQCKEGNYAAGDECWTDVRVSTAETVRIIPGTVLVYTDSDSSEENGFEVRAQSTSTDSHRVAGIAQSTIATGDSGRILVRGPGKARLADQSVNATGDALFFGKTDGGLAPTAPSSRDKAIAFARQTSSTTATVDVFVTVI